MALVRRAAAGDLGGALVGAYDHLALVQAERAQAAKGILGPLGYAVGAVLAGTSMRSYPVRVEVDGAEDGALRALAGVRDVTRDGGTLRLSVDELDEHADRHMLHLVDVRFAADEGRRETGNAVRQGHLSRLVAAAKADCDRRGLAAFRG